MASWWRGRKDTASLPHHSYSMRSIISTSSAVYAALLIAAASAYSYNGQKDAAPQNRPRSSDVADVAYPAQHQQLGRRAFVTTSSSALATVGYYGLLDPPRPASAAADTASAKVKVTPVAHTFVASADKGVKPLRENDATRFFTNARIVVPFYGGGSDPRIDSTFAEILDLTIKRKAEKGPGVTPGDVVYGEIAGQKVAPSASVGADNAKTMAMKDTSPSSIASALTALSAGGDVLILPPMKSTGTAGDGKVLTDIAEAAHLEAGARGGQVLGLLIDGPRDPQSIMLSDGGYTLQPILWYSV